MFFFRRTFCTGGHIHVHGPEQGVETGFTAIEYEFTSPDEAYDIIAEVSFNLGGRLFRHPNGRP